MGRDCSFKITQKLTNGAMRHLYDNFILQKHLADTLGRLSTVLLTAFTIA